jgi:hypothetical protein
MTTLQKREHYYAVGSHADVVSIDKDTRTLGLPPAIKHNSLLLALRAFAYRAGDKKCLQELLELFPEGPDRLVVESCIDPANKEARAKKFKTVFLLITN